MKIKPIIRIYWHEGVTHCSLHAKNVEALYLLIRSKAQRLIQQL
jgi:hypothetical protein